MRGDKHCGGIILICLVRHQPWKRRHELWWYNLIMSGVSQAMGADA